MKFTITTVTKDEDNVPDHARNYKFFDTIKGCGREVKIWNENDASRIPTSDEWREIAPVVAKYNDSRVGTFTMYDTEDKFAGGLAAIGNGYSFRGSP